MQAAYQLCISIQADLEGDNIEFQKGQLTELYGVATNLIKHLKRLLLTAGAGSVEYTARSLQRNYFRSASHIPVTRAFKSAVSFS